ncbi:hypothetical protein BCY84_18241 [Trypanosoma cruzi cruzi]|nr:hypothetical protein BCY84_18241 [Trypanosoma cruzi cruzi]
MHSPSSALSCDSAESIYNLLCAVQAQANADEEEIKTRRLHIANCEREMERTNEEIRFLSEQHEEALDEVRAKRLRGEEQKLRHAGAVEMLQCTREEVAGVVDALFACELPLHPVAAAAAGASFEPPQESLPPTMIRSATTSLKEKIRAATEQRRRQVTEPQRLFTAVAQEANLGNDAGNVFAVRFRQDAASETSSDPTNNTAIVSECAVVEVVSSPSERPRRKVITFNDAQLEVHIEKNYSYPSSSSSTATLSEAPPRRGLEQQEVMRPAAVVSVYGVLNMKRLPRRTFWQKEPRPQK